LARRARAGEVKKHALRFRRRAEPGRDCRLRLLPPPGVFTPTVGAVLRSRQLRRIGEDAAAAEFVGVRVGEPVLAGVAVSRHADLAGEAVGDADGVAAERLVVHGASVRERFDGGTDAGCTAAEGRKRHQEQERMSHRGIVIPGAADAVIGEHDMLQ
jgi:hypothetical protein